MKKNLKKFSLIVVLLISLCVSLFAAYTTECNCHLVCPYCRSLNTNHYHPDRGSLRAQVRCRDCGYEWIEENPEQDPKKEDASELNY